MSTFLPETALGDVRVLDLTSSIGLYCTKLLADLGADVIKIERPGGDPVREIGPFVGDTPHPERSLYFFHFNTNKRSVTLNVESEEGRAILKKLVKDADVVVETFPPGYLEGIGLGYPVLREINPGIILTSITGFGQTGPYRDFKAPDIVGVAMGGLMYLGGFPEDPPNYPGADQGYHLASADAAIGILAALCYRDLSGEGQWVDVSMQQSVSTSIELAMVTYDLKKIIRKRTGRQVYRGWSEVYPCKDGHILCSPLGAYSWRTILAWMQSEGLAGDLAEPEYEDVLDLMADRQTDRGASLERRDPRELKKYQDAIKHIEDVWEAFLMAHTREELYQGCQERGVRLMPVYSARDISEDPQLLARDFFVEVEHPDSRYKYPGGPYRLSRTAWRMARHPPLIGEHNLEVYGRELGLAEDEVSALQERGII